MDLKEITPKMLKNMKKQIELFEFYGISEEKISELPKVFAENEVLQHRVDQLEKRINELTRVVSDISSQINNQVRTMQSYFTLPTEE